MTDPHPLPIVADFLREHGFDEAAKRLLATCATCKWWGRHDSDSAMTVWGWDVAAPSLNTCSRIPDRDSYGSPPLDVAFAVASHDDSSAVVFTRPTFGCTLHEARDTPNAPPA